MTVPRDNIDALTGLRAVAAFSIVLGHAYRPWLEVTAIGMPLFFTLSGFIIHYVYSDAFSGHWRRAVGEFATARFARLYPLYLVLLAFLILHEPQGHSFGHLRNISAFLAYLAACWTWWPFRVDDHPAGFFYVSWSVSTEIFFYLVYALLLYRIAAIRSVRLCLIMLISFCFIAYVFFFGLFITRDLWEPVALQANPALIARTTDYSQSFYRWLLYLSPYCRLPEFIGGVLTCQLFLLSRRQRSVLDPVPAAWLGTVAIVVMAILYAQFRYFGEHDRWLDAGHFTYGAFIVNLHHNFLFAPSCYALIFALACGGWALARVLSSRPALFCGEVSYSTYLSHETVLVNLGQLGAAAMAAVPYLVLVMALVYLVSWVLYSVIEMPAKKLLRMLFASWTVRRASVPASE